MMGGEAYPNPNHDLLILTLILNLILILILTQTVIPNLNLNLTLAAMIAGPMSTFWEKYWAYEKGCRGVGA